MVRYKRQMLRLYFVLVLVVGLFGGWYASRNFSLEVDTLSAVDIGEEADWIDFFAALGEETIQLFLGFTSDGS